MISREEFVQIATKYNCKIINHKSYEAVYDGIKTLTRGMNFFVAILPENHISFVTDDECYVGYMGIWGIGKGAVLYEVVEIDPVEKIAWLEKVR